MRRSQPDIMQIQRHIIASGQKMRRPATANRPAAQRGDAGYFLRNQDTWLFASKFWFAFFNKCRNAFRSIVRL